MAHIVEELNYHPTLMERFGEWIDSVASNSTRAREIDRLSSLTDEQLAARGLRRQDIVHHVMRDVYWI